MRSCEQWLARHFALPNPVQGAVDAARLPERTLKRRFKSATGSTLIDYVQNLRVEEAKRLLETEATPFDEISAQVGYEDPGFFRPLFRRRTGLTPGQYRRMFRPFLAARQPMTCPRWHGPARDRARAISGPDCPRQTARSRA